MKWETEPNRCKPS